VRVTRITFLAGLALYLLLWALALAGATQLVAPLVIPLVLAVLVAAGVGLQRWMGLPARRPHFRDRDEGPPPT
jgi:hypothetical protein